MTLKAHTEWTPKELWEHEQVNFSLHIAIMFQYLKAHGLAVDDFIRYTGEKVLPSWKRRGDTPEIATASKVGCIPGFSRDFPLS